MPELPDITAYVEALEKRLIGHTLDKVKLRSVSLLRTYDPPYTAANGTRVLKLHRMGKRVLLEFEHGIFFVFHLMKLGRFRWADPGAKVKNAAGKVLHGSFEFSSGVLYLTEMGSKKRASLHVVAGQNALAQFERGGAELAELDLAGFSAIVKRRNHTLKRILTDPSIFSGVGNAYSDEILHAAKLSPVALSQKLNAAELARLFTATQATLELWIERLREEVGEGFPDKVTAFRPEMAVHGKYGQPCPECGEKVQRIVYAARETNYCARCQTKGRPLADRGLSRLLGKDWPKTLEELEERRSTGAPDASKA